MLQNRLQPVLDPNRLDEKKVQLRLGTMLLHPVDEKIVRVQLVRHH